MNIAFIVDEFPSISQTFILNQITGLLERGHQVDVFTREIKIDQRQHADVERFGLMRRTHYLGCPLKRWPRLVRGADLCLRHLRAHPRAILSALNVFRYGRGASSLTLLFQTAPFFRRYDIVHCQFGHNGRLGAILKRVGLQKKIVVTFHGVDIRAGLASGGAIYDELWDQVDCLIAISKYNLDHLLRFGGDPEKIVYHPVGIDCRRFSCPDRPATPRRGIRLLSVARLVKEKGLESGLRAVGQLCAASSDPDALCYDIIGEGPLQPGLERLIDELGLRQQVRLLGAKSQDEVIAALHESDILLAPSLAEALPVSLMEAHAAGLPVVATRVGSTDQIVRHEVTGFLVPPGDVTGLYRRLQELIAAPEKRLQMGRHGRRHVEEHFDIERLNDRLVDLYTDLLAA
jgi:colanic acid/amylovoran biosynthesis glycosyltransferase